MDTQFSQHFGVNFQDTYYEDKRSEKRLFVKKSEKRLFVMKIKEVKETICYEDKRSEKRLKRSERDYLL